MWAAREESQRRVLELKNKKDVKAAQFTSRDESLKALTNQLDEKIAVGTEGVLKCLRDFAELDNAANSELDPLLSGDVGLQYFEDAVSRFENDVKAGFKRLTESWKAKEAQENAVMASKFRDLLVQEVRLREDYEKKITQQM